MKSAIILALTSSALAVPFGNVIDAMFGTANEARRIPPAGQTPSFHPIGTGSGTGFPFPIGTGAFPSASGHAFPHGPGHHHRSKSLAMDYQLAPTAVPKIGKVVERQAGSSLPGFTLLNPSDAVSSAPEPTSTDGSALPLPSSTEESSLPLPTEDPESRFPFPTATGGPSFPFPTGGFKSRFPFPTGTGKPGFPFPTGGVPFPTGGFPGTGIPSLPTTLATLTRGPRPTAEPELPGLPSEAEDSETGSGDEQSWSDWLEGLFGGANGNGKSEVQN